MTDQSTEADASTDTSRPVRVPNVSPGALSGLGHHVIGSAAQEVYDAEAPYTDDPAPTFDPNNPEHVDALVSIVPEERQLAVRQALTGEVTDLSTGVPDASDPTGGALPTGEVHDAPVVPDDTPDTVDGLLGWVHSDDSHDGTYDRALVVLRAERERETPRTTLVEPLQAITDAYEAVPEPVDS